MSKLTITELLTAVVGVVLMVCLTFDMYDRRKTMLIKTSVVTTTTTIKAQAQNLEIIANKIGALIDQAGGEK